MPCILYDTSRSDPLYLIIGHQQDLSFLKTDNLRLNRLFLCSSIPGGDQADISQLCLGSLRLCRQTYHIYNPSSYLEKVFLQYFVIFIPINGQSHFF